jgi:hypothetical protein
VKSEFCGGWVFCGKGGLKPIRGNVLDKVTFFCIIWSVWEVLGSFVKFYYDMYRYNSGRIRPKVIDKQDGHDAICYYVVC